MAAGGVDGLLERLVVLEANVCYQELPTKGEATFKYVPGQVPILLSAPHGAVHTRQGKLKDEDEYTAGMALLVAELTGAHALYARHRSHTDPNWYAAVPYKRRLERAVRETDIRFVLDLHAANATRDFGVALGTMRGKSCPEQRDAIIGALERGGFKPEGRGLDRLDVDETFTAVGKQGQETITRYAWERLHVPAAQLEFHPHLRIVERRPDATSDRPFHGDPDRIKRAVRVLVRLVRSQALL